MHNQGRNNWEEEDLEILTIIDIIPENITVFVSLNAAIPKVRDVSLGRSNKKNE